MMIFHTDRSDQVTANEVPLLQAKNEAEVTIYFSWRRA
jgi:hypothetical protein